MTAIIVKLPESLDDATVDRIRDLVEYEINHDPDMNGVDIRLTFGDFLTMEYEDGDEVTDTTLVALHHTIRRELTERGA